MCYYLRLEDQLSMYSELRILCVFVIIVKVMVKELKLYADNGQGTSAIFTLTDETSVYEVGISAMLEIKSTIDWANYGDVGVICALNESGDLFSVKDTNYSAFGIDFTCALSSYCNFPINKDSHWNIMYDVNPKIMQNSADGSYSYFMDYSSHDSIILNTIQLTSSQPYSYKFFSEINYVNLTSFGTLTIPSSYLCFMEIDITNNDLGGRNISNIETIKSFVKFSSELPNGTGQVFPSEVSYNLTKTKSQAVDNSKPSTSSDDTDISVLYSAVLIVVLNLINALF